MASQGNWSVIESVEVICLELLMLQDQRWNHIGLPAAHDFTFVRQKLSHGEIDTIVARRWNLSYFWWRV